MWTPERPFRDYTDAQLIELGDSLRRARAEMSRASDRAMIDRAMRAIGDEIQLRDDPSV